MIAWRLIAGRRVAWRTIGVVTGRARRFAKAVRRSRIVAGRFGVPLAIDLRKLLEFLARRRTGNLFALCFGQFLREFFERFRGGLHFARPLRNRFVEFLMHRIVQALFELPPEFDQHRSAAAERREAIARRCELNPIGEGQR